MNTPRTFLRHRPSQDPARVRSIRTKCRVIVGRSTGAVMFVVLLGLWSPRSQAAQIAPDPNPSGNTITVSGAESHSAGAGQFDNRGHIVILSSGSLHNTGEIEFDHSSALIDNYGTLDNDGEMSSYDFGTFINREGATLNNTHAMDFSNASVLDNYGTVHSTAGGAYSGPDGIGVNDSGVINNHGTFNASSTLWNAFGTFNNFGLLNNDAEVLNSGDWVNHAGATMIHNSIMYDDFGSGRFQNFGTLGGVGSQDLDLEDSGTLAPGNSAGVYSIGDDYFKSGGTLEIELGGHSDGGGNIALTEYDWVNVTDDVEILAPTLVDISLIDGLEAADLSIGDRFDIIQFGGTLSGFENLSLGTSPEDIGWSLGADTSSLFLTVQSVSAVPEPSAVVLMILGLLGLSLLGWRHKRV